MSRLADCFATLQSQQRCALVPYLVAGDPSPAVTVPMMHQLVTVGCDIIELGIPFSDPMAEGPVIQAAHERALTHHVSLHDVLAMVTDFRRDNTSTPIVLMGYANPIMHRGYTTFAQAAETAGVDGVLVVDMPPEEAQALQDALRAVSIDIIFLLAPTTSAARMQTIIERASGYLYYVALKGVTGAGHFDQVAVKQQINAIKALTDLPLAVGFGIKEPAVAAAMAPLTDAVVVGSALVKRMAELLLKSPTKPSAEAIAQAADLLATMRCAMDATHLPLK